MDMGMGRNMRTMGGGRKYSIPNRNTNSWDILPSEVLEADKVYVLKERLDRHMKLTAWRPSIYRTRTTTTMFLH